MKTCHCSDMPIERLSVLLGKPKLIDEMTYTCGCRGRFHYTKTTDGKYKVYCSVCQTYEIVDYSMIKQIRANHLCPYCHHKIIPATKKYDDNMAYIMIADVNVNYGYEIHTSWSWERELHCSYIKNVYQFREGKTFVKGISMNMGSLCRWRDEWRQVAKYNHYAYCFYGIMPKPICYNIKQYYKYSTLPELKSNQEYIVKHSHLSVKQIEGLVTFNLKNINEILKYSVYFENNRLDCQSRNIYLLDYLDRNNISFNDYVDYENQCKELGLPIDKPKDFKEKHYELSRIIRQKKDEQQNEMIISRYAELMNMQYQKGDYSIEVFKDYDNIEKVANQLRNCMASNYAKPYAEKTTNIFYGKCKQKVMFGIEVANGKLVQLRAKYNDECNKKIKQFVNEWCNEKGIIYG